MIFLKFYSYRSKFWHKWKNEGMWRVKRTLKRISEHFKQCPQLLTTPVPDLFIWECNEREKAMKKKNEYGAYLKEEKRHYKKDNKIEKEEKQEEKKHEKAEKKDIKKIIKKGKK